MNLMKIQKAGIKHIMKHWKRPLTIGLNMKAVFLLLLHYIMTISQKKMTIFP